MVRLRVVTFDLERPGPLLEELLRQLPRRLGLQVEWADRPLELPGCFSEDRQQYDAGQVLHALARCASAGKEQGATGKEQGATGKEQGAAGKEQGWRVLGVTGSDLFLSVFTHVLGAAQLSGSAAVVSTHRLSPEAVGLPPDPWLLGERLVKEAVHELGHTFGLRHCRNPACAMFAANNPDEVDLRSAEYQGECRRLFFEARGCL